jgi:hypothetical protein
LHAPYYALYNLLFAWPEKRKIYIKSRPFLSGEKMRNNAIAFLIICLLITAAYGCSSETNADGTTKNAFGSSGSSKTQTTAPTYNTGLTGITMAFLLNSPPTEMYDGQTFPFALEITNTGNTTTNPYITLSGFDKNIIHVDWTYKQPGSIPKKGPDYPVGGYGALSEEVKVTLPAEVTTLPTTIKATACYDYITDANVQVCVDPDPTNNKDDVCAPKTVSITTGQSAPLAISSVVQQPSRGITSFIVTIKNTGGGDVLKIDKVSQCMAQLSPVDTDVVDVFDATLGTQVLSCTPTTVRLVKGLGVTNCKITGLTGNAYTTTLMLRFKYGYKSSITKSVNVRRM